jgi:uncharacterized protein YqhQ
MSEKKSPFSGMLGGQAVIEGVMIRSPWALAVAVRRPDGEIVVKRTPHRAWSKRARILGLPVVRGGVALVESLTLGLRSLMYSAEQAAEDEEAKKKASSTGNTVLMAFTMVVALLAGLGLFFYLPLVITEALGVKGSIAFNVVDGLIRVILFLGYLYGIGRWSQIARIFGYHGAEHQAIHAYEAGVEMTPREVSSYPTGHPRCGTSFLLIVMVVSVAVFALLGKPHNPGQRLLRLALVPVIGGVAYELIKATARYPGSIVARAVAWPGVALQALTTRQPDESQAEVAIEAFRAALKQEDAEGPFDVAPLDAARGRQDGQGGGGAEEQETPEEQDEVGGQETVGS